MSLFETSVKLSILPSSEGNFQINSSIVDEKDNKLIGLCFQTKAELLSSIELINKVLKDNDKKFVVSNDRTEIFIEKFPSAIDGYILTKLNYKKETIENVYLTTKSCGWFVNISSSHIKS